MADDGMRVNVALSADAQAALERLMEQTHKSKTDIVNIALRIYDMVNLEMRAGNEIVILNPSSGATQVVRILL